MILAQDLIPERPGGPSLVRRPKPTRTSRGAFDDNYTGRPVYL